MGHLGVRSLATGLVIVAALGTGACSQSGGSTPSAATTTAEESRVCIALADLAEVQSKDTPQRLIRLTRAQLQQDFAEQRSAQLKVLAASPSELAADYQRVLDIDDAIGELVLNEWGDNDGVVAKERATGARNSSVAEYVSRAGIPLDDGSRITWADYVALRDTTFANLSASC